MSDTATESVTLDGIPSTDVAIVVLYAADKGVTVSQLALNDSLNGMVQKGIQVLASRYAAAPDKIPAALLAELESVTSLTNALNRLRDSGTDLSAIVSAISA